MKAYIVYTSFFGDIVVESGMDQDITAKQVFSYIYNETKPFRACILVMLWVAIFWSIDLSLRPYLLKVIINRLTEGAAADAFQYLTAPALAYLAMYFLMTMSFRLYGYFVEIRMIPNLRAKIANGALGLLIEKSHNYYQNHFSGSLANKVNDLTSSVPEIIQIVIDRFFSHSLALMVGIYTLWQVNYRFAIFMLLWAILFIISALLSTKRLAHLAHNWSEYGSIITGKIVDVLSNILSVRLFAAKSKEKGALAETFQGAVASEQKLQWTYLWIWFGYGAAFFMLQALTLYFLIKGRQDGWITIGDFALVFVINVSIIDSLWHMGGEFSRFSKYYGRITQALRVILSMPDIKDEANASDLIITEGKIAFHDVKFHYKGAEPLFQNKSVTIKGGQKVGLVGYSGSGKSTFVNLILRLHDVTEGSIVIDGQDIKGVSQDSLRKAIAMIPQDPSLFHRSLMENILYGRLDATTEEVIEASKRAHAHGFISKLPKDYESLVGERGVKLSGGQRQRIAIARAILKNAPILILDEATSQLDSVIESYIQESLWELMKGKTTIVIAHRLSTLLHMDRIIVFDQGKIAEDGPHHELLAHQGLYKTLWDAQVGGFLPKRKKV